MRFALRTLRSSPGFTAVAVVMLALGIGANTAIFSVVSAVLLRSLPFPEPDRLVLVWANLSAVGGPPRLEASPADYVSWSERNRSFASMAAFAVDNYNLTGAGNPDKITGVRVTGQFFGTLRLQPLLGRTLTERDDRPGASPVVVIDERIWRARFAADPDLVGRTVHLNGLPHTVVGVVPADFRFPSPTVSLWVPARLTPAELETRSAYFMYVLARLKPGVSLAQAQADMSAIGRQLGREFPPTNARTAVAVSALHEHLTRDARPAMAILFAAVVVVLLIAGVNLANLLLTRGAIRIREVAVRQALGATHGRVTRQLLTENAVLAGLGAVLGVALAVPALRYLARLMPLGLPDGTVPALDLRVLLFTAGVAMVTVVGFGTGPAFVSARVDLESVIRSGGGRGATGRSRLRSALVVAELTLTVVLLVAAGLLLRSYANVLAVDPGFSPRNLLVAETPLPPLKYADTERRSALLRRRAQSRHRAPRRHGCRLREFPAARLQGRARILLGRGAAAAHVAKRVRIHGDRPRRQPGIFPGAPRAGRAWPRFRRARRAVVGAGRHRQPDDGRTPLARPGSDWPADQVRPVNAPGLWLTVVGVVGDVQETALDSRVEPEVYLPSNQGRDVPAFFWPQYLVVRTTGDPVALAAAVREAVWSVDRDQAVSNLRTMDDIFEADLLSRNTQLTLVGAFAAARIGDGRDRTVWRAGVFSGAASTGNRHSRGARGRACDRRGRDAAQRAGAGRRWDRARSRPRRRRQPRAAIVAVRRGAARRGHACGTAVLLS